MHQDKTPLFLLVLLNGVKLHLKLCDKHAILATHHENKAL